jgi:hypothetical protein
MNMFITLGSILLIASVASTADSKSATYFADGIIIEREISSNKGILDVPLPAGLIEGSLRVKPGSGTVIQRVDLIPAPIATGRSEKELDTMLEQKNRLNDRLRALETREEIFKAAAKSQSGKAPRKTKTNPDPLHSIRQGTEFAITELEAVYTARRKTELEIRRLENRIASAKNNVRGSEALARIAVSPARGNVTVRYAIKNQGWTPRYDIYLNSSGSAQVNLSGQFPGTFAGYLLQASPAMLTEYTTARTYPVQPGPLAEVARFKLTATDELFETRVPSIFSFKLINRESTQLPAGEANIYRNGEYVGRLRFEGISSGRTRKVTLGR